jgi:hypothetical protein
MEIEKNYTRSGFKMLTENMNPKTGIHYGVISPHNISPEALDDIVRDSEDTIYEESREEFTNGLISVIKEYCEDNYLHIEEKDIDIDSIIDDWDSSYDNDNHSYHYTDAEYELHVCDDNYGIYVIKSPYYTYTRPCSPCSPNAGDLDNPVQIDHRYKTGDTRAGYGEMKTYCLDKTFFENDKVPYEYYEVATDKKVI